MSNFNSLYTMFKGESECSSKLMKDFERHCRWEIKIRLENEGFGLNSYGHIDEIYSELLVKIAQNLNQFNSKRGTFKNWINIMIRHLVIDFIRKMKRQKNPNIQDVDEEVFHRICEEVRESNIPEAQYIHEESLRELHQFLNHHLSQQQYLVLKYRLIGLKNDEIAERLGKTRDQITKTYHRATQNLKRISQEKGESVKELLNDSIRKM